MEIESNLDSLVIDSNFQSLRSLEASSALHSSNAQRQHVQAKNSQCQQYFKKVNTTPNYLITPTPPPSPLPNNKSANLCKTISYKNNSINIDILVNEITHLYEQSLRQCDSAETRYERLDRTTKFALDMQRNSYEQYVDELLDKIRLLQRRTDITAKEKESYSLIEERNLPSRRLLIHQSLATDKLSVSQPKKDKRTTLENQLLEIINTQEAEIRESEQSVQKLLNYYINELEKERLENINQHVIISKQEKLIAMLEEKLKLQTSATDNADIPARKSFITTKRIPSKKENLLKAQVELQKVELEDKKKLLSLLVDQKKELQKKVDELLGKKNAAVHFDIASEQYKYRGRSCFSINHQQKNTRFDMDTLQTSAESLPSNIVTYINHVSPPPSPPPKTQPPPTPNSLGATSISNKAEQFFKSRPSYNCETDKVQEEHYALPLSEDIQQHLFSCSDNNLTIFTDTIPNETTYDSNIKAKRQPFGIVQSNSLMIRLKSWKRRQ